MSNNLVQLIFDQFIDILLNISNRRHCKVDECDFEYKVRELNKYRLIDIIYVFRGKCEKHYKVSISIDFTNICKDDLITCQWVDYLTKLAIEFVEDICPKKLVIVREEHQKCRQQPPKWEPLPCKNITTIIRKKKPKIEKPECEVTIEKECECVPICKRKPCVPKQHIIIKYQKDKKWRCGDHDQLVVDNKKPHDFKNHKGKKDYNDHEWNTCCDKKEDGHENNDFYNSTVHH